MKSLKKLSANYSKSYLGYLNYLNILNKYNNTYHRSTSKKSADADHFDSSIKIELSHKAS